MRRVNTMRVSAGPARSFCHRPLWMPEWSAPGTRNCQTITRISHNVSLKREETFLLGPSLPTAGSTPHEMQSPPLVGEQTTVPGCSFRLNSVNSVHHPTVHPLLPLDVLCLIAPSQGGLWNPVLQDSLPLLFGSLRELNLTSPTFEEAVPSLYPRYIYWQSPVSLPCTSSCFHSEL